MGKTEMHEPLEEFVAAVVLGIKKGVDSINREVNGICASMGNRVHFEVNWYGQGIDFDLYIREGREKCQKKASLVNGSGL